MVPGTGCGYVPLPCLLLFGLLNRFELERFCRAKMSTDGITAAQIALDHQIVLTVMQRATEGTSRNTCHTLDTLFMVKLNSTGFIVA